MEIKSVYYITPEVVSGIHRPAQFLVVWSNGDQNYVPIEPLNRDYQLVEVWYNAQDPKPFEFDFNKPPEA